MKRAIILTAILMLLTVGAGAVLEPDLGMDEIEIPITSDPFILKAILGVLALIFCLLTYLALKWRHRPECLPEKPKTFDGCGERK